MSFDQMCKSMLLLAKAYKEACVSITDITSTMHRFNQHKYDGWDRRKIKRYKRREKQLRLKMRQEEYRYETLGR